MNIIIISKDNKQYFECIAEEYLIIDQLVTLIDEFSLSTNDERYDFNYLIIEDIDLVTNIQVLNLLTDDGTIVTNMFGGTTLDHVFIGSVNNALDLIINGE